jgi:basic amino acid/polyamine antiporter, APA family
MSGDTAESAAGDESIRNDEGLRRAITPKLLLIFIVGDILGGGIYALVGEVGAETGGAIWVAFLLALVMAAFTAGSYAELVSKYPHAGGAALYVNRAFRNRFVSFVVAFAVVVSGITSASALARGFGGDYLSEFVDLKVVFGALVLLALITIVNLRGISESVKLNVGFTIVEVCGLLLIVLIAVVAIVQGDADTGRAFEFKEGSSVFGAALAGAALAFYALVGFEDSVNVAEETQNPSRTYPKVLFIGLAIAGLLYFLVTVGASAVVPTNDLASSSGPLLEVVKQGPLGINEKVFSAIGLLALSNGALINMIMASRLLYGMAKEDVVPAPLGTVGSARRTPWVAILFTTAIAAVLIITGDLSKLADTTVALLVCVFAIVNISVLVLRRDRVDHDHFRVPTVVPILGVGVSIALLTQIEAEVWARAGILMLVGLGLWLLNELVLRRTAPASA